MIADYCTHFYCHYHLQYFANKEQNLTKKGPKLDKRHYRIKLPPLAQ